MCQGHKKLYLNKQVSDIVGITPRQVLSWTEKGLIEPFEEAMGIGTKRRYDYVNLLEFSLCESLFTMGLGFRSAKIVLGNLRKKGWLREWAEDFRTYFNRDTEERILFWEKELKEYKELDETLYKPAISACIRAIEIEKMPFKEPIGIMLFFIDSKGKAFDDNIDIWPRPIEHLILFEGFKERVTASTGCIIVDLGKIKHKIDKRL